MKIQRSSRWFSLLLFMTMIAGCTQSTDNKATSSPVASVLPYSSALPTETILPTLTPSATVTPTQSSTPTAIPTLLVEDARKRLLDLLATNGNCKLPCLWGITPGASNYYEGRNILMPLSNVAEFTYFDQPKVNGILMGSISPLYVEGDLRLNTIVDYWYDDNSSVNFIAFRALEERLSKDKDGNTITTPIFDSPTFLKRVQYYSLSHVLTEQGVPDSVMISASILRGEMNIALLYPNQGIWVNYTTVLIQNGVVKRGCPTNSYINMELFPPENPDSFFTLLNQTDWGITKSRYRTLEDATSMSVKEFYEIFRNPTDKCIETPSGLWPTPESGGG